MTWGVVGVFQILLGIAFSVDFVINLYFPQGIVNMILLCQRSVENN